MAEGLNNATFVVGDYMKISHLEQNNRLRINGFVEDAPQDLSKGTAGLNLNNSYFYFEEETLKYSNTQLDLSADKTTLIAKVEESKEIEAANYTKESFARLEEAIKNAEGLISESSVFVEEITAEIEKLNKVILELKVINTIEFKGYNNEVFMTLKFDNGSKKFIAQSNGKIIHPYHGTREYARVEHYDKDGNLKNTFRAYAHKNADEIVSGLNATTYEEGDYIKFYHLEQGNRLAIKGHINNFDGNLQNGVGNLDLNNSKFNLDKENITYM